MADAKKPAAKKSTAAKAPAKKKPAAKKKVVDLLVLRHAWESAVDNTGHFERRRSRAGSSTGEGSREFMITEADKELQVARDAEAEARDVFLNEKRKAEKAARK